MPVRQLMPASPLPSLAQFGVYRWENDGSQKRVARKSAALLKSW